MTARTDADRLRYLAECVDGLATGPGQCVEWVEVALELAFCDGREEPNDDDVLEAMRRMVDLSMDAEAAGLLKAPYVEPTWPPMARAQVGERHRFQSVIIELDDGSWHMFTGRAAVEPGDTRRIAHVRFTEPRDLPPGHEFAQIEELGNG